jgi:hypothetical protein
LRKLQKSGLFHAHPHFPFGIGGAPLPAILRDGQHNFYGFCRVDLTIPMAYPVVRAGAANID